MESVNNLSSDIMIRAEGIRFSGHESLISFHWIGFPNAGHDYQVRIVFKHANGPARQICLEPYLTPADLPNTVFNERMIPLNKLIDAMNGQRVHAPMETLLQAIFSTHGMLRVTFDRNAGKEFLIFQLMLDDIPNLPRLHCVLEDDFHSFFSRIGA